TYTEAPEGILRSDLADVSEKILSQQANNGSIKITLPFQNISSTAFQDSLFVELRITGESILQKVVRKKMLKAVAANSTENFEISLSTLELTGINRLSINVNPQVLPEQHYF